QNSLRKNINNNKSSLLFANFLLKYSDKISFSDVDTETLQKLYSMSLRSESAFVRYEALLNLHKDASTKSGFEQQLSDLKRSEKVDFVQNLL
ncbi:MAG TPA: glutamine--tRNA ligase, partial [Flavobacterium sp.]|nr:glutamine--tRNA ligase [Flavobacterium sp.]